VDLRKTYTVAKENEAAKDERFVLTDPQPHSCSQTKFKIVYKARGI